MIIQADRVVAEMMSEGQCDKENGPRAAAEANRKQAGKRLSRAEKLRIWQEEKKRAKEAEEKKQKNKNKNRKKRKAGVVSRRTVDPIVGGRRLKKSVAVPRKRARVGASTQSRHQASSVRLVKGNLEVVRVLNTAKNRLLHLHRVKWHRKRGRKKK